MKSHALLWFYFPSLFFRSAHSSSSRFLASWLIVTGDLYLRAGVTASCSPNYFNLQESLSASVCTLLQKIVVTESMSVVKRVLVQEHGT